MKTSEILQKLSSLAGSSFPSDQDRSFVSRHLLTDKYAQFFFLHAKGPAWVDELRAFLLSKNPLSPNYTYPYIFKLLDFDTETFFEILSLLRGQMDSRGIRLLIQSSEELSPSESLRLLPIINDYVASNASVSLSGYSGYLDKLFKSFPNDERVIESLKLVVRFFPDPDFQEKSNQRMAADSDYQFLTPLTKLDPYEYERLLEKGVRLIVSEGSYEVSRTLIDALADCILFSKFPDELESCGDKDGAEFWCPKLFETHRTHAESKELLVNTMTFACEVVFEKKPEHIENLDELLRQQRWRVFKRLRWHLYGKYPTEQALPWIRESILEDVDYSERELPYEFQLMIRRACEVFGSDILKAEELAEIIRSIKNGPSKEEWREWMEDRFTEEGFEIRKRFFHYKQLRPFSKILEEEALQYFNEVESRQKEELTDDDYLLWKNSEAKTGFVSHKSPITLDDLKTKTDEEVLEYINTWNSPSRDADDWLIQTNVSALAQAFKSYFFDTVIDDKSRLQFWMQHKGSMKRPVFFRAILEGAKEVVDKSETKHLEVFLDLCEWAVSHPDEKPTGNVWLSDESFENPNWNSSRRAAVDFVEACFKKESKVPIVYRKQLFGILRKLCLEADYDLDEDNPVFSDERDYLTDAINRTRSKALENLSKYGHWVQYLDKKATFDEIADLLDERFFQSEIPITLPEYAILGLHFLNLLGLAPDWVQAHKRCFFMQETTETWKVAFNTFLHYNRPWTPKYELLCGEFEFALQNLKELEDKRPSSRRELIDKIGQHLFTYYIWELYPLEGDASLLSRFYEQSSFDKKYWANLFEHVGQILINSPSLSEKIEPRIKAFFEHRAAQKEPVELEGFSFWLRAECLSPKWRLESFYKTLISPISDDTNIYMTLESLAGLLENETFFVMKCFDRLIECVSTHKSPFIKEDCAEEILKKGLYHADPEIKLHAENSLENLLKMGYHDFLKLVEEKGD